MEDFANLMQRLLEIQSGGRERSPELIAEDERLMENLRTLAAQSAQPLKRDPDYTKRDSRLAAESLPGIVRVTRSVE